MNLYLVTRTDDWDYDEYDAFVVASESAEKAANYAPNGEIASWGVDFRDDEYSLGAWTKSLDNVVVELIGTTDLTEGDIPLTSFNAG